VAGSQGEGEKGLDVEKLGDGELYLHWEDRPVG
jgi:hypothetical protein